jgi:ATP-dependent DNA ligase
MIGLIASQASLKPRSAIKASSFLIDGEAVITSDDGMSDFRAMRKADRARLTRPLTAGVNLFREH